MRSNFRTAEEHARERAQHPAMAVVDVCALAAAVRDAYRNEVLLDAGGSCLRSAVFEGEYRWHCHPDSSELLLVVEGTLQIDFQHGRRVSLTGVAMHDSAGGHHSPEHGRCGRTVNLTFEKRIARMEFFDPGEDPSAPPGAGRSKDASERREMGAARRRCLRCWPATDFHPQLPRKTRPLLQPCSVGIGVVARASPAPPS